MEGARPQLVDAEPESVPEVANRGQKPGPRVKPGVTLW